MITSIPSADDPPQSTREQLRAALATALCKQRFKRLCTEEEITLAASQVRLRTFWITMLPKALIAMWFSISLGFFVADVLDLHWLLYLLLAVMVAWSLVPLAAPEILQVLGGGRPWMFGLRPDPRPNLVLVLAAGWILLGAAEAVLGGPTAMAITHGVPVLVALLAGGVVLIVLRLRSDRGIEGSIPLGVPIAVVLLFVPLFSQELWVAAAGLSVPRFLLLQMITVLLLLILLWRQLRASAPTVFVETARELQVMDPDGKSDDPLKRLDKLVDMDLSSQEARELVESSLRNPKTPRRAVVIAAQAKSSFDRQLIGRLVPVVVGIGLTACLYIYLLASVTIDMQSVAGWTGEAVPTGTVSLLGLDVELPAGPYVRVAGLLGVVATAIFIAFVMTEDRYATALAETVMHRPVRDCLLVATTYADLRTPGDDFEDAIEISGPEGSNADGDSTYATRAEGEPAHASEPSGRSLWYAWTPSLRETAIFDTKGSGFDTVLAVYTGSELGDLALAAANDDAPGETTSRVTFPAIAGQTYHIAVDGWRERSGPVRLNWATHPPPPNDLLAEAARIGGDDGVELGDNAFATAEPGEPAHAGAGGDRSLWFRWTAARNGPVVFDSAGSSFPTVLAAYLPTDPARPAMEGLVELVSDWGREAPARLTFPAVAGREYLIALDGRYGAYGSARLTWRMSPTPANDDLANAERVAGRAGWTWGDNSYATREADEPLHAGSSGGKSLWYRWQAPDSHTASFDTGGSAFDTLLAVYEAPGIQDPAVTQLEVVAANDDAGPLDSTSRVTFPTTRGEVYYIAVDGYSGANGLLWLNWSTHEPPPNNPFAAPHDLPVEPGSIHHDNTYATRERGEPHHAGVPGGQSLWYRWAPGRRVTAALHTHGSGFDTLLAVYTGFELESLVEVAANDDADGQVTSRVRFAAEPDTVYRIAVDGYGGRHGPFQLHWEVHDAPPNDRVGEALPIDGPNGVARSDSTHATREPGEPQHAEGGTRSVWFRWTAPEGGDLVTFDARRSGFDANLAVYGPVGPGEPALGELEPVRVARQEHDRVAFYAAGGAGYLVAVEGPDGSGGPVDLEWAMRGERPSAAGLWRKRR